MDELERQIAQTATKAARWGSVGAISQPSENADTDDQSRLKWAKVYRLFGASGETAQDEAFAAVNLYLLRNGCSPLGKYRKPITTAGGQSIGSGELVKITGKLEGEIRQFMRGRLEDSYMFLKHNAAVREDEQLATLAENAGVSRECSWLLADWLGRDCVYFVGDEAEVYNKLRTSKIAAARAKRLVAIEPEDRVMENAPEAKMNGVDHSQRSYNGGGDLF